MKVTYLLQNPGLASRTPDGWTSAVVAARRDGTYAEDAFKEVEDSDVLVVGIDLVPDEMLARAKRLKLIQRLGIDYANINVQEATRLGIHVCNMSDFNAAPWPDSIMRVGKWRLYP